MISTNSNNRIFKSFFIFDLLKNSWSDKSVYLILFLTGSLIESSKVLYGSGTGKGWCNESVKREVQNGWGKVFNVLAT